MQPSGTNNGLAPSRPAAATGATASRHRIAQDQIAAERHSHAPYTPTAIARRVSPPYSTFSAPSGTPASIASAVALDDEAPAALAPRYIEWRTCTGVGPLTRL